MTLPGDLTEETWADFHEYRLEIKKPLTPVAERRTLAKLERLSAEYSAEKLLDMAITQRWTGIWEREECRHETSRGVSQGIRKPSVVERVRAANAEPSTGLRVVRANE